ncbi:MAG: sulfatase-like hydrolase/transferase [Acidobacteria bacterium]|nr:sulfatase-like hydrolase/transferase [Acidobacteriota bacterium]
MTNIVFVHVDQMHPDAMSAFGNRWVETPAMDGIARDGVAFRQAYAAQPVCCPARSSWFTGRTPLEHGVLINAAPIDQQMPDLGQWLRKHGGYHTAYAGKWHIPARDVRESFDLLHPGMGMGEVGDGDVGRAAAAFLRNRTSDEPFFLSVGFLNPHDCCYTCGANGGVGKFGFASEIESKLPPLPPNFDPKLPWLSGEQRKRVGGWSELDWRYYIYSCYRQTEMADAHVGLVYDALARSRFADNTLFVFASDHGEGMGHHGRVLKNFLEDESWRVPTIVVKPGAIRSNKGRIDETSLVSSLDLPATICDYAGAPALPDADVARSLRPLLEGKKVAWRDHVFGETEHSAGVRNARYKAIFYPSEPTRMFDMQEDPWEMRNLAASPEHADVRKGLEAKLREYVRARKIAPHLGDLAYADAQSRGPIRRLAQSRVWYESIVNGGGLSA